MSNIIKEIKEKNNIVEIIGQYLQLEKYGQNYKGLCPFHGDSDPSLVVSSKKNIYKCFVCGANGDNIKFEMEYNKISFGKAVEKLAQKVGVDYKAKAEIEYNQDEKRVVELFKDAQNFLRYSFDVNNEALIYAKKRGLEKNDIENFGIGYCPDGKSLSNFLIKKGYSEKELIDNSLINSVGFDFFGGRIIFPLKNINGDIIAFSGRTITEDKIKYLNSSENILFKKGELLYNIDRAISEVKRTKKIYIVEGYMDVIAFNKIGIHNVVAVMGTALNEDNLRILYDKEVNLMLDSDRAGMQAMVKTSKMLINNGVKTFILLDNNNRDPYELVSESGDTLINVINNKVEAIEFIYRVHKAKYKNNPNDVEKMIKSLRNYLENYNDLYRDYYSKKISEEYNFDINIVKRFLFNTKKIDINELNLEQLKSLKQVIDYKLSKNNF